MSNNQQPQGSDSKGKLPTLEPPWRPSLFHPNEPNRNVAGSTAPIAFSNSYNNATPGIGNLESVEGRQIPPAAPPEQVSVPATSSETGEVTPAVSDVMAALASTTCSICGSKCRSLAELDRHVSKDHAGVRWPCPICGGEWKTYRVRESLRTHVVKEHSGESLRYYCPVEDCERTQKGYLRRFEFEDHLLNHPGHPDIIIEECLLPSKEA